MLPARSTGGLESEKKYPYEGKDDKCEFSRKDATVKISGALNISHSEDGTQQFADEFTVLTSKIVIAFFVNDASIIVSILK